MIKNPNYSQGQIYKLYNEDCNDVYIGSTTRSLCLRKKAHIDHNTVGRKSYGDIFSTDNYKIEKMEDFPCESSVQLRKREREILELTKSMGYNVCNQHAPWRDPDEAKRLHKQAIKNYYKSDRGKEKKKGQNQRYQAKIKLLKNN
jgi:hypothetical protein